MTKSKTATIMAVSLSFALCSILLIANLLSAEPAQQQPLIKIGTKEIDLIYELEKAEIIPTVIDKFHPQLSVSVSWPDSNTEADYGNTLHPSDTKEQPEIKLHDGVSSSWSHHTAHPQLTLALTDPDAPSRDNPENSEHCHWLATNFPLCSAGHETCSQELDEIMPWKPPGPPPKTGKHRYVFVALSPLNGTSESLHLVSPSDRNRWGYRHERTGLRKWAEEMGLGVVGANFLYAQNDEQ